MVEKGNYSKYEDNKHKNNPFNNIDIFVVRVKGGKTLMSRPCIHCVNSMKIMGVRRVYYTTGDYLNNEWICENVSTIQSNLSSGNRERK